MPLSTQDFQPPFDPTAYLQISGAQLLQYLAGASPYASTGLTISTQDIAGTPQVPDAYTNTKWQRYLWIRQTSGSNPVSLYVWNAGGADQGTFQKWISATLAGIGVGSITGALIAPNTITDVNIGNNQLNWSKLFGKPNLIDSNTGLGGALSGTLPNPSIANNYITGTMIAGNTITNANLQPICISNSNLQQNCIQASQINSNGGTSGAYIQLQSDLKTLAFFTPAINAGGRILQMVGLFDSAIDNTTTTFTHNVTPTTAGGKNIPGLSITVVPINAASALLIEVTVNIGIAPNITGTTSDFGVVSLFNSNSANAISSALFGFLNIVTPAENFGQVTLRASITPGSIAPITFYVRYGLISNNIDACTMFYNNLNGIVLLGGTLQSSIKVTELL